MWNGMLSHKLNISLKSMVVCGGVLVVAACQSGGKDVTLTPGQAQAAFYECLDTAMERPVRGGGGDLMVAGRFLSRCNGEMADWEEALVASGMPPAEADARISGIRDQLRNDIADGLSGPI